MGTSGLPAWPWAGIDPTSLPAAERALVQAWRGAPLGAGPSPDIAAEIVTKAQVLADLVDPLRDFPLHFGFAEDPAVTFREAKFLAACALTQRGATLPAQALFMTLLPCRIAQSALQSACAIGQHLKNAGLFLRNPWPRNRSSDSSMTDLRAIT